MNKEEIKNSRRLYFNNYFNRVIVLNAAHNTERREYIKAHFEERGITNWEFQDAIDYKLVTPEARKFLSAAGLLLEEGHSWLPLNNTQIVSCLSMLKMFLKFKHNHWERVLHVEDDVFFYEDYQDKFHESMKYLPEDWDAVHFYSHIPTGCGKFNDVYRKKINDYFHKGFSEGSGSLCIGFTRRAIELMFTRIFPIDSGIDGVVNTVSGNWYHGHEDYSAYIINDFVCQPNRTLPNSHKKINKDNTETRKASDADIIPPHMTSDEEKKDLRKLAESESWIKKKSETQKKKL